MVDGRVGFYVVLPLLAHCFWRLIRRPKLRHPPSPFSLPFVGNLFSIPRGHEYFAFAKLGEQLKSDIIYLEILGHEVIVLNSAEAALELLEKRAVLYSDRPPIPMIKDPALMNWPDNAVTIGYNEIWRHYRRMMNVWLNKHAVAQYNDLQDRQAQLLLRQLLLAMGHDQPFEHVKNEIFFVVGSSMLQLAYGYKPKSPQDHFFMEMQRTIHNVLSASTQTNFLVNLFPALLHVPNWFPGTGWKRTGREWGVQQNKAKTEPYEWLRAQLADGTHQPSLLSFLLQDHELLTGLNPEEQDKRLKEIGIALFGAGTDSTASLVVNFVAAMVLNPRIQARAQLELDTVLGWAVLPRISDKERLPYIGNIIDEIFRLYPVVPLGRDPRHYKNPETFNPDRYLNPEVPRMPIYGWGRRKCPGIHFAEASVFITVASLLATFTFTKKQDSNGEDIIPQIEAERNSIAYELKPFDFQFKPRSEEHRQLILGTNIDEEQG
ncbi:unnamed protein product [Rhizoctonia solani]|uniref:O-methylsterigmatocystin oxidoreductase n=1 Tax=Rhizoctonia solani TaxID=456999 RepID=A0A8H2WGU6_9AGAM|nr:unnamed protein product [Rhizoctonia solani]